MTPVEILATEHKDILKALELEEKAISKLEKGEDVQKDFWTNLIEFLRGFADRCHHAKEEKIFLPEIKKRKDKFKAFVNIILREHEMGRMYIKALENEVLKYYSGDKLKPKL